MRFTISTNEVYNYFTVIMQNLTKIVEEVTIHFQEDSIEIKGMDKCHVCYYHIKLPKEMFSEYNFDSFTTIGISTSMFYRILNTKEPNQISTIEASEDNLHVKFTSDDKKEINKFYKISLIDISTEELNIPDFEYDAEFELETVKFNTLTQDLGLFGDEYKIICTEDNITMNTSGAYGETKIEFDIDDLENYAIVEDAEINLVFSGKYFEKMCSFSKLSSKIEIKISNEYPMYLSYRLVNNGFMTFYLAPKIED